MRILQAHVSSAVASFKDKFLSKYGLTTFKDPKQPLVMFGMYNTEDMGVLVNHKAPVILVWCGSDSLKIKRGDVWALKRKVKKHYAMSRFISDDLKKHHIAHAILPITPSSIDINPEPRGDSMYCYGLRSPSLYNTDLAKEVSRITGYNLILAKHDTFTHEQLMNAYKESFIGLRLTPHDGLPNTVLELGMMGRRSIYNGDIPHCIKWKSVDDICENVIKEYQNRHQPNEQISKDIKNYLNISDQWLYLK